jgi:hypothetical protein
MWTRLHEGGPVTYDDYITTDYADQGDPRCEGCGWLVCLCGEPVEEER